MARNAKTESEGERTYLRYCKASDVVIAAHLLICLGLEGDDPKRQSKYLAPVQTVPDTFVRGTAPYVTIADHFGRSTLSIIASRNPFYLLLE